MAKTARPTIEKYVSANTPLVEPDEHAHDGLRIPEIMMAYGEIRGGIKSRLPVMWKMVKGMFHIRRGYSSLKKNPDPGKTSIDASLLGQLHEYALSLGCVHVGYTQVPRNIIFSNQKLLFDKAIVVTLEMNKDRMSRAPKGDAGKEVWRTYERLGHYVNLLADMMRKAGYAAHAGSPMGGDVNYPLLAQKAGLGYIGKHGLLITPETGPSLRIAAVYTNIENLPYTDSDEHAWIGNFCKTCQRCVSAPGRRSIHRILCLRMAAGDVSTMPSALSPFQNTWVALYVSKSVRSSRANIPRSRGDSRAERCEFCPLESKRGASLDASQMAREGFEPSVSGL